VADAAELKISSASTCSRFSSQRTRSRARHRTAGRRAGSGRQRLRQDHHHRQARHRFKQEQRSVLLCASDTFRAAAIEQLEIWGQRTDTQVIRQSAGSDPSAVLSMRVSAAKAARSTTSSSIPPDVCKPRKT
jgi:hypothetical protein